MTTFPRADIYPNASLRIDESGKQNIDTALGRLFYADFLAQIGRHVEIFAFDNGWLTFFKATTIDRFEL